MNDNDKCRVSFFDGPGIFFIVPSHPGSDTVQRNAACRSKILPGSALCLLYFATHRAYAVHRAHAYLLVHSHSLALPTPRLFRRSGWGRPGRSQVRCPAAPTPHLHSEEGGWGSAIGIQVASTPGSSASASASASASSRRLSGRGGGKGGGGRVCKSQP
jgi:hypothetical protein